MGLAASLRGCQGESASRPGADCPGHNAGGKRRERADASHNPQVPSTVASYDSHHRWVVLGFVVSMAGVALLVATEALRRNRKPKQSNSSNTPVE